MSLIWGGELQAKLSPYTSAITKMMMANKYGKLNYSTKAYPSPVLTDEEWEIAFRSIQGLVDNGLSSLITTFPYTKTIDGTTYKILYRINQYNGDSALTVKNVGRFYTTGRANSGSPSTTLLTDYYNIYKDREDFYLGYVLAIETDQTNHIMEVYSPMTMKKIGVLTKTDDGRAVWFNNSHYTFEDYAGDIKEEDVFGGDYWVEDYNGDSPYIEENRAIVRKAYFKRTRTGEEERAIPQDVINGIISMIDNLKKIGYIDTQIYDLEVVDRMEKCIVRNRDGLKISTAEQKKNLLRYYQDDRTSSYIIYYDAKTMLPLLSVGEDGIIKGWDAADNPTFIRDRDFDRETDVDEFIIKPGTIYYKWSRTVKYKEGTDDGILGRTFVIDAETFPEAYKIIGETYIRDQKTGKDQRYQFVIHRAQVSADTSITLEADGDPTTFSMSVDVLTPPNDIMIELKQFDVDEDVLHGGTRIVPQKSHYTYTPTTIEIKQQTGIDNEEMY